MIALAISLALATAPPTAPSRDPVIAVVGDIVCDPHPHAGPSLEAVLGGCASSATFQLVAKRHLAGILALGDEQYENGSLEAFQQAYSKTWGTLRSITHPTPGNHEYYTPHADGYFTYFGRAAGDPGKGYYSFDLAGWHMISLNGNCSLAGGCGQGSPQEVWLRADLVAHHAGCTLAYWHQPRFSSGFHHDDRDFVPFWNDLYAARADIVLNGHDHDYERYAPQTPLGASDPQRGIREFVVGTGGRSHTIFLRIDKNSDARAAGTFGVMFLTLHPHGYDWQFSPIAGYLFSDQGSGTCHGREGLVPLGRVSQR